MPLRTINFRSTSKICLIGLLLLSSHSFSFAQLKNDLLKLQTFGDSLARKYPAEKIYMQFDKPYYALGDTAWFKIYLFNAPSHLLSAQSGLLHIDIISDSGKLVKQYMLPLKNGISWGDFVLNDKEFIAGSYTLRAYTNWMRNFAGDGFYYKRFNIYDSNENSWLISSKVNTSNDANGRTLVSSQLQLAYLNRIPYGPKPVQVRVVSGTKSLYKQNVQTDQNGMLNLNFQLPDKSLNPTIVLESGQKDQKATIPLNLSRADKIDLQFLPEGGNLVADLPANIAFKAMGEDGKGVQVSGIITDHNQQQIARFQALHNGMGKFNLLVKGGETYTAKLTLANGDVRDYVLPEIKKSGTVLQVKNVMEGDSVELSVAATDDMAHSGNNYFLIGKARGIICYAAIINFYDNNYIRRKVSKMLFPSGITHFILTTSNGQPLNERLTFFDHHDNLRIELKSSKTEYELRNSIALKINVINNEGLPVAGNFSLAVTDDALVKTDTLNDANILSRILLTSDMKGYVEGPGYYLQKSNNLVWQALDNLLLTQGWVSYEPVSSNLLYEAEKEFTVRGKVVNIFGKPVKGSKLLLFSKSPGFLMDTITNSKGEFVFDRFPVVDTPVFVLKATNKNGKSFNVGIHIDEIKPPVSNFPGLPAILPWYINSDSTLMNYLKGTIAIKRQQEYQPDGKHKLKEVVISAQKTIKGSQNLNGAGNADQVFDEQEMEHAGKKSWMQVMLEKVKGFREYHVRQFVFYTVNGRFIIFIIDGSPMVELGVLSLLDYTTSVTYYLNSHTAEEIKGIEVNASAKNNGNYGRRFLPADMLNSGIGFIEITTRSGHGPFNDNTPGMYLYKPLPISWPKQFYKPRYSVNDTTRHQIDMRSTIDWEPNVNTDKDGKASVSFYAADRPSTYTVIIEGTDMNGNVGLQRYKIIINKSKEALKSK